MDGARDPSYSEVGFGEYLKDVVKASSLPKEVMFFDTTLRDGEQTPGVSFTADEKVSIAKALDELGVDVIEAGFPVNSEEEERIVREIAKAGLKAKVCGLARSLRADIDSCIRCDVQRVHLFIATSDIHLRYKLNKTEEEALRQAVDAVEYVRDHGLECEFSCEDATRTPIERLLRFYKAVEEAGAAYFNVPDTVGVIEPDAMKSLISSLRGCLRGTISVHCHNDLGLAVANSIAGVKAGAEQIHVTVNGLGERAGNASLEQTAVALRLMYGVNSRIRLELLTEVSKLVQRYSMINITPNYPVVGSNAFAHESGIHVHGVLQNFACYEPYPPEVVGQKRRIVMGKHTGRHAVSSFVKGYFGEVPDDKVQVVVERVKHLSALKKKISEDDVLAIAEEVLGKVEEAGKAFELEEIVVVTGNKVTPTASVQVRLPDGVMQVAAGVGVGPVDAASNAIQRALGKELRLLNFKLEAISGGTDSLASVQVTVEDLKGNKATGSAVSGDIVMSSVQALVEGLNRLMLRARQRAD
jgi:2-isopropylmalate synthase